MELRLRRSRSATTPLGSESRQGNERLLLESFIGPPERVARRTLHSSSICRLAKAGRRHTLDTFPDCAAQVRVYHSHLANGDSTKTPDFGKVDKVGTFGTTVCSQT